MSICINNDLGPIPKVPVNIIPSHQVRLTSPHKIYNAPDSLISLHVRLDDVFFFTSKYVSMY